ncbi:MAG: alpha/beta fold hydrolase [Bacteroidota bacterium]
MSDALLAADVTPTRYPVVLMHGIGLIAHMMKPGGAFDAIAEDLSTHGVQVFAPRVQPYSPIRDRCQTWQRHLRTVLGTTGAEKINLVGFSSGGLDARYLVAHLGAHTHVATVTTLASPHRGSRIAELPLRLPEPLRQLVAEVVNRVAATFFPEGDGDLLAMLHELTPRYMTDQFNPATPDHPDVTYYSLGAQAGRGASNPASSLTWLLNQYLYLTDGPNDGYVPVESMQWTGYGGALPADHAQLAGLTAGHDGFDAVLFYRRLVSHLAAEGW